MLLGQQQQQGETVTTPLASVQEEKDENEWPQGDENAQPQDNGKLLLNLIYVWSGKG